MKQIIFRSASVCLIVLALIATPQFLFCQNSRQSFNNGWKFHLGDEPAASGQSFDDKAWRSLRLPHDWSIELPFDSTSPTGTGGGALRGGIGWYRKTFMTPAASGKNVFIEFDGVYCNSEVFINGHSLGIRPNGFISFRYDLTAYLKAGQLNTLAVKVDNGQQPNSRWYSGSGIYRNVWLLTEEPVAMEQWGSYITATVTDDHAAKVHIETSVSNRLASAALVKVTTTLLDAGNHAVGQMQNNINCAPGSVSVQAQEIAVASPRLWSVSQPYLYTAVTSLEVKGRVVYKHSARVGIRQFSFDAAKGFFLNGAPLKIIGVCDHHDLGCLGTAINTRALERQLEILKAMGCNGIRTSHNPPAPELLDLCDSMGFIVMDEAFDMWKKQKNKFDYHLNWDQWHEKDLRDQVLRDRNHPSVFIWSIGNEIPEQWVGKDGKDSSGISIARELAAIVRSLDTTRPITSALNNPYPDNAIYRSGALDLVGFNYHHKDFASFPQKFPGQKFIATETVSALQTRGHYDMPSDSIRRWPSRWDKPVDNANKDLSCSAYDNCSAPWGSTHEETLKELLKYDFASGMYIWTGFDYIGEPTPYPWPARSSYFGIIDLAGFPKDVYYLYQSLFTEKPVLHLFPHWNWQPGQDIDIWAYYSKADEVELFVNGKSMGVRKKTGDALHVSWRVKYEPGEIKAISRRNGRQVLEQIIRTAAAPAKLVATADRNTISGDGKDLSFISIRVLDKNGNLVPDADNLVNFTVEGGQIEGVDNGSPVSMESFRANHRKAFNGLCLAVISASHAGVIRFTAKADGLQPAVVTINAH